MAYNVQGCPTCGARKEGSVSDRPPERSMSRRATPLRLDLCCAPLTAGQAPQAPQRATPCYLPCVPLYAHSADMPASTSSGTGFEARRARPIAFLIILAAAAAFSPSRTSRFRTSASSRSLSSSIVGERSG